jgi:hypothetical protein
MYVKDVLVIDRHHKEDVREKKVDLAAMQHMLKLPRYCTLKFAAR